MKGFTLIETMIYIALLSLVLYEIIPTTFVLIESHQKLEHDLEVLEVGNYLLNEIDHTLLRGQSIQTPPTRSGFEIVGYKVETSQSAGLSWETVSFTIEGFSFSTVFYSQI